MVFLGDVMGRGVAAAAAMAEVRAATRAFASIDPDPAFVLHRLDQMVGAYGSDQLVTLVYVLADATSGRLLGGQRRPPAPVGAAGRRVGRAAAVRRRSAARGRRRTTARRSPSPFGVGDTLLAFTDGLIERRDEDIDTGLERLAQAVPALAATPLASGVERVVEAVRDDTYDDDMAALGLRRLR